MEINKSKFIAEQFMLHKEMNFASSVFDTGIWGTDLVGGTGVEKWDNYAVSDPLVDVDEAKDTIETNTGKSPNLMIIGVKVWRILRRHPLLLDMYKHTRGGILGMEQVKNALEIDKLVVARAIKNTAEEGATFAGSRILGNHVLLLHVADNPGLEVPSAGYTFQWKLDGGGGYEVPITRFRDGKRDRDMLRGKTAYTFKTVGADLGYFFSGMVD